MMSKCNFINSKYIIQKNAQEETIIEEQKFTKIKYTYNIFEIIFSSFLFCCISNKLKLKKNLTEKANYILYKKLDIVLFVRNMILLDIMNETILGLSIKNIINFLSRPIITLKGKVKNELTIFYRRYKSSDFKKFIGDFNELAKKTDKQNEEKDLISLTNKHLKQLLD